MSKGIFRTKFLKAILQDRAEIEIGDFVIFKHKYPDGSYRGVGVLTKDLFKEFRETENRHKTGQKTFHEFNKKIQEKKVQIKDLQPNPITEEELKEWLE